MHKRLYVQYGCGLSAPKEWINFDASPTLRIQQMPVIGALLKKKLNVTFPSNVLFGDIVKGLPVDDGICDGVYSSHTLEHLSLEDFKEALRNTYRILKTGGIFRCVLPDLEKSARNYIAALDSGDGTASVQFMNETSLGVQRRPSGVKAIAEQLWGNAQHLWMWDKSSLAQHLAAVGFKDIRECTYGDCEDRMFLHVENPARFQQAIAIECRK